jgi:hypothetical protein
VKRCVWERLGIVDQFLDNLPVQDSSGCLFGGLKGFGQEGDIARVLDIQIAPVDEEIIERLQLSIPQTTGTLGKVLCQGFKELVDFIRFD